MSTSLRTAAATAALTGLTLAIAGSAAAGQPAAATTPATSAAAATSSCSLLLNEKLVVYTPDQRSIAYLDQDCVVAGTVTAQWEIRHRMHGLVAHFSFPTGSTRAIWTLTDSTPLGNYDVVPGGAFDEATAGDPTPIPQNTLHPSLRLRSWLTLGARRTGRYVVLHGLATRWSRSADAAVPWRRHPVRFWFRTCQLCQLHEMRQRRTNDAGRFSFRVYSPRERRWSARTDDRPSTWGARIVGNPGERIA